MKRVLIAVVLFAAVSLGDGAASGKATEEPASEAISMFYEAIYPENTKAGETERLAWLEDTFLTTKFVHLDIRSSSARRRVD
jgi:hypothetical protein